MGVTTKTVTIYTCDRCGFGSEDPFARGGYNRCKIEVAVKGYDGATGGVTREVFLCGDCAEQHRLFLRGHVVVAGGEQ